MKNYVFVFECSKSMRSNSKVLITVPRAEVVPTSGSKLDCAVSAAKLLVTKLNGDDKITVLLLCGDEVRNVGEFTKTTFCRDVISETGLIAGDLDNFNATRENVYWSHNPNTYLDAIKNAVDVLARKTGDRAVVLFASMNVHDCDNDSEYYDYRTQMSHRRIKLYLLALGFGKAFSDEKYLHDFHIDKSENMSYMFLNDTSEEMSHNANCVLACNAIARLNNFYDEWKGVVPSNPRPISPRPIPPRPVPPRPDVTPQSEPQPMRSGIRNKQSPIPYNSNNSNLPERKIWQEVSDDDGCSMDKYSEDDGSVTLNPPPRTPQRPSVQPKQPQSTSGMAPRAPQRPSSSYYDEQSGQAGQTPAARRNPSQVIPKPGNVGGKKILGGNSDYSDLGDTEDDFGEDDDGIMTAYNPVNTLSGTIRRNLPSGGGARTQRPTSGVRPSQGAPNQGGTDDFGEDDDD